MAFNSRATAPIGIFDSGLGGLSVLKEVEKLIPSEDVLYIGDTERQPYGPRTIDEVREITVEITQHLVNQGVKAVIIACNTASIAGGDAAQSMFPGIPVFGMISAGVRGALNKSHTRKVGIWGTEITIESQVHHHKLLQEDPGIQAKGVACSDLLRLAEKGKIDDVTLLRRLAKFYYEPLVSLDPDCLILGCTDFTCLRPVIDEIVPQSVAIIDPAEEVVRDLKAFLLANGLAHPVENRTGHCRYFVTGDDIDNFTNFTLRFMDTPAIDIQPLKLAKLEGN